MTYVPDYVRPVGPKSPVSGPTTPTTPNHSHRRIESFTGNGTRSAPSSGLRERSSSSVQPPKDSNTALPSRRRSATNPTYTPARYFKAPQDRICSRLSIKDRLKSLESEADVKLEVRQALPRRQRRHRMQKPFSEGSDKERQSEDNSSISSISSIQTAGDSGERMIESVAPMPKPDIIASNQPKFDVPAPTIPLQQESKTGKSLSKEEKQPVQNHTKNIEKQERRKSEDFVDKKPKAKEPKKVPKRENNVPKSDKQLSDTQDTDKNDCSGKHDTEIVPKTIDSNTSTYCSKNNDVKVPAQESILPTLAVKRPLEGTTSGSSTEVEESSEYIAKSTENLASKSKTQEKTSNGSVFKPIWRTPSLKQVKQPRNESMDIAPVESKKLESNSAVKLATSLETQRTETSENQPAFDTKQEQIDATVTLAEPKTTQTGRKEGSELSKETESIAVDESNVSATTTTTQTNDTNTTATSYPVELRSPRHEHSGQGFKRQNTRDKRNARVFIVPSSSDSDMDNNNQMSKMERDFAKLGLARAVDLLPNSNNLAENNNHTAPKMPTPELTIKHVPPVKFVPNLLKPNSKEPTPEEKRKAADEQSLRIYPELLTPSRSSRRGSKSHDGESKKDTQKSPSRRRKSTRSSRSGNNRSKSTDARRAGRDVQRNRSNSMCDPQRMRSTQEAAANAVVFGTSPGPAIPYIDDVSSPVEDANTENGVSVPKRAPGTDEKKSPERGSIHRSNSADVLSSLVADVSPAKLRRARASSVDRSTARGVHRRSYQIATMARDGDQQSIDRLNKFLLHADVDRSRDSSLCDQDATTRSGYLHFKVATIDKGKRTSSQKSWKQVWATLKDQHLYFSKDMSKSKSVQDSPLERQLSQQEDMQSLNVQSSLVGIAYNYLKRRNVFKLTTFNGSEYLFQAENRNDMLAWISAIQKQSCAWEDGTEGISEDLILRKTNQLDSGPKSDKRNNRKRSPKPSQKNNLQVKDVDGSRRFKWRGSVNKIVKKFGTGQPFVLNGTFGVHLEDCPPSISNEFVPFIVELCCRIVQERGLHFIGIYRVPGNNAALSALQEDLNNHGAESIRPDDERLRDLNVVSSLLKSFFRKLPEPLFTNELYHDFIQANRQATPESRLNSLRKLVHMLPGPHYETLKFLISHLRLVADNCESNKMEVRNLAIVFGPTLVRNTAADNTATMVTDMSDQCRIIESIIDHADWFFSDNSEPVPKTVNIAVPAEKEHEAVPSIEFLLDNVGRKPGDTGNTSESAKSKGSDDSENSFSRDLMDLFFRKKWKQLSNHHAANEEDDGGFGEYRLRKHDETTSKKPEQSSSDVGVVENVETLSQPPQPLQTDIPERLMNFYREHLERLSQTTIGQTLPAFSSADSSPRTTPRHSTVFNAPLVFPAQDIAPRHPSRSRVSSDSHDPRYHVTGSYDMLPNVSHTHRPPPPPDMSSRSVSAPQYKHPPNPYQPGLTVFRASTHAPEVPPRAPVKSDANASSQILKSVGDVSTASYASHKVVKQEKPKPASRKLSSSDPVPYQERPKTPTPQIEPKITAKEMVVDVVIDENKPPEVVNERLVDELPKPPPPTSPKSPISRKTSKSSPGISIPNYKPTKGHKEKSSTTSLDAFSEPYKTHSKKASVASLDAVSGLSQKKIRKSPLKENLSVPVASGSSSERLFSRYDPKRRGIRFAGAENDQLQFLNPNTSPKKQQLTATERLFNDQPLRRKPSTRENRKQKVARRHTLSGIQDLQQNSPSLRFKSNLHQVAIGQNLSMYDLASDSQGQRSAVERLNPKGATSGMTLSNWIVQERLKNKTPQSNSLSSTNVPKRKDKSQMRSYI